MIARRSLLLAGATLPASVSAYAQCVTDTMVVDACLGGVRRTVPQGMTFERNFLTGSLGAGAVFTRASTGLVHQRERCAGAGRDERAAL